MMRMESQNARLVTTPVPPARASLQQTAPPNSLAQKAENSRTECVNFPLDSSTRTRLPKEELVIILARTAPDQKLTNVPHVGRVSLEPANLLREF